MSHIPDLTAVQVREYRRQVEENPPSRKLLAKGGAASDLIKQMLVNK